MTKDELIALAKEGKASIEVAYTITITRYCITQEGINAKGDRFEYPAVFMSISDEDNSLYEDAAYFTDGVDESDLTDDEAETLAEAIEAANTRR